MVLWEDSGTSLSYTRDGWGGDWERSFLTKPLSFIGTYEGKAFLRYHPSVEQYSRIDDHPGAPYLHPGTATLYYDGGGDIDLTINIPGEFNRTVNNLKLYDTNRLHEIHPASSAYDHMRVEGDVYGYAFDNLGKDVTFAVHGFTSGSTALGTWGFLDETRERFKQIGRGGWGVSYSDSSRTPAPELSHCSTQPGEGGRRYYCQQ